MGAGKIISRIFGNTKSRLISDAKETVAAEALSGSADADSTAPDYRRSAVGRRPLDYDLSSPDPVFRSEDERVVDVGVVDRLPDVREEVDECEIFSDISLVFANNPDLSAAGDGERTDGYLSLDEGINRIGLQVLFQHSPVVDGEEDIFGGLRHLEFREFPEEGRGETELFPGMWDYDETPHTGDSPEAVTAEAIADDDISDDGLVESVASVAPEFDFDHVSGEVVIGDPVDAEPSPMVVESVFSEPVHSVTFDIDAVVAPPSAAPAPAPEFGLPSSVTSVQPTGAAVENPILSVTRPDVDAAVQSASMRMLKAWARMEADGRKASEARDRFSAVVTDAHVVCLSLSDKGRALLEVLEIQPRPFLEQVDAKPECVAVPDAPESGDKEAPVVPELQTGEDNQAPSAVPGVREQGRAVSDNAVANHGAVVPGHPIGGVSIGSQCNVPDSCPENETTVPAASSAAPLAANGNSVSSDEEEAGWGTDSVRTETQAEGVGPGLVGNDQQDMPATGAEPALVSDPFAFDSSEAEQVRDLLNVPVMPQQDLRRELEERRAAVPGEDEIGGILRPLRVITPGQKAINALMVFASIMIGREGEIDFTPADHSILRTLVSRCDLELLRKHDFEEPDVAFRKIIMICNDALVVRRLKHIQHKIEHGFENEADLKQARDTLWLNDLIQEAYPSLRSACHEYASQIHRSTYDLSVGDMDESLQLHEGMHPDSSDGVMDKLRNGVSRALASRLPDIAQEALVRFANIGRMVEDLDRCVRDACLIEGTAYEDHSLFGSVMLLKQNALAEVRGIKEVLRRVARGGSYIDQLPMIVKNRDAALGVLFDEITRDEKTIDDYAAYYKSMTSRSRELERQVENLETLLGLKGAEIANLEEKAGKVLLQDVLVQSALLISAADERFQVIRNIRLKVDVGDVQYAIVLVHGLGLTWSLLDGLSLEGGDQSLKIDLINLYTYVVKTREFDENREVRLRVVLVGGHLGSGREQFIAHVDDVVARPEILLTKCSFDDAVNQHDGNV